MMNRFFKIDLKSPTQMLAIIIIAVTWGLVGKLTLMGWQDLQPPFLDIRGEHEDGPTEPGGVAKVRVFYSRAYAPTMLGVETRMFCGNDKVPAVLARPEDAKALWRSGMNITAVVLVRIPENAPPNSVCFFDAIITYKRHFSQDLRLKIPADSVVMKIGDLPRPD